MKAKRGINFPDKEGNYIANRKIAIDYKKSHHWDALQIRKKYCSVLGFGDGITIYYDIETEEFVKILKQLHKDYP